MQYLAQKKKETPIAAAQAQSNPAQKNTIPSRGMILPIVRGSSADFESKRLRRSYFRRVHAVLPEGPVVKIQWSHILITFTEQDLNLQCYPHTDAMIVKANISWWEVTKIIMDYGSSTYIIFASAFDQMNINMSLLQPLETPLICFDGKRI